MSKAKMIKSSWSEDQEEKVERFRPEKIRLSHEEELLLKEQTAVQVGREDLRTALECVRVVQAGYQLKMNEAKESGDVAHVSFYKLKRDRLLRWLQDYTTLVAESGNCMPGGNILKKGNRNVKRT